MKKSACAKAEPGDETAVASCSQNMLRVLESSPDFAKVGLIVGVVCVGGREMGKTKYLGKHLSISLYIRTCTHILTHTALLSTASLALGTEGGSL